MADYQHILWTTDLGEQSAVIGQRALDLAQKYQARVSVLHVVNYIPPFEIGGELTLPAYPEIEEQLVKQAQQHVVKLTQKLNVSGIAQHVVVGSPRVEITRFAAENRVDLIVVGRHSRRGLGALLGSIASGVLHHAVCDVLAVKV